MSITTQPRVLPWPTPPFPVRRFTVDEYHRILEAGVFAADERSQLLEGWIVPKMTRNPPHEVTIVRVSRILSGQIPAGWHGPAQLAITTADSEPEPDFAVVRGEDCDYLHRHPAPHDLALVVEVVDSSLVSDRGAKARLYARAEIPIYWLINLVESRIEVYTDPTGPDVSPCFRQRRDFGIKESVPFVISGQDIGLISVADLLP
ncbi:MAG TPA: Uma2 family endonuclease [Isosphaeraceae bacterium]|jgi:Uma2 family endonuclease|nr:Uma2 family endonuclease [Isosphaeraceae bacterium]